jgi:hypothetical protein
VNALARFFIEFLPRLRGYAGTFKGEILRDGRATLEFEGFLRNRVAQAGVDPAEFTGSQWFELADAVARSHVLSGALNRGVGTPSFGPGVPGSGVQPGTPGSMQRYTVAVELVFPSGHTSEVLVEVSSRSPLGRAGILEGAMQALGRGEITTDPSGSGTENTQVKSWRVLSSLTM